MSVCEFGGLRVRALAVTGCLFAACFSERSPSDVQLDAACSLPVDELREEGRFVPIRGFEFAVDTLRVATGTRVTWVNCEQPPGEDHTVTSDNGVWASPFFGVGRTFSRTFSTPGAFPYHCVPHPHMRAVVIVQ